MKRLTYGMLVMVLLLTAVPALQADELDFLSADGGACSVAADKNAGSPEALGLVLFCTQCKVCSSDLQCGGTSQGFCIPAHQIPCSPTSTGNACICR